MKRCLFTCHILLLVITVEAQIVFEMTSHRLQHGDILHHKLFRTISETLSHKGYVWDLRDCDPYGSEERMRILCSEHDSLVMNAFATGIVRNYHQHSEGISLIGTESSTLHIEYDIPETTHPRLLLYGDTLHGVFNGAGRYCDKSLIHLCGTYSTTPDAHGIIINPEGDTIPDVLRLHTVRHIHSSSHAYNVENADSIMASFSSNSFPSDSIFSILQGNAGVTIEDEYRWYSASCRYPVMTQKTTRSGFTEKTVRTLFSAGGKGGAGKETPSPSNSPVISGYRVTDVSHDGTISIECTTTQACNITFTVCDVKGMAVRHLEASTVSEVPLRVRIDCSSLYPDIYVVYIRTGNEKYSEKTDLRRKS